MDTDRHSYEGTQRLVYYNNSPDTITEVHYHLFYEAFKPGSMMDIRDREVFGGGLGIGELAPDEQGSVNVGELRQDGRGVEWSVDQTVLHATLWRPVPPGDSTVLQMRWRTRIPQLTRRGGWMSREGIEFSMAQWYPKLAAYDEHGWHHDEYVGREFYGVFGAYDVAITLPARYVLGATGAVTNPDEVGCGYQLGAVDTVIFPSGGSGTKTWRFHADSVHDFAWVADPDYVHHIGRWEDVTIHVLVAQYLNDLWRFVRPWTQSMMDYYSQRFGRYSWPQFTVAMAGDGGMEYPQLIMITGQRTPPSLAGVIAHELGHQWYYGMIANNETQEPWLDEGFTQYLTDEASREVLGTQLGDNPHTGLDRIVYPWENKRWVNTEGAYGLAIDGYDEPLCLHHDRYRERATSSLPYSRGEAVLRMLQYMFGDSLFDAAMRSYHDRWKFRQPGARDFERAMEQASGMRLDWFFNQWIGTTRDCDYAIEGLTSEPTADGYRTTIALANEGQMTMPVDLTLIYDDGSDAVANVPVENWRKPGVDFVLPRWTWVSPRYSATFTTPRRVVAAVIDTSTLLFDIDRTNNTMSGGLFGGSLGNADAAWYRRWDFRRPMDRYSIRLRPTLWYSLADGLQPGFVADGGYAYDRYNTKAGVYYNAKSGRVDYDLRYNSRLGMLGRLADFTLRATNADGVQLWSAGIEKTIRPMNSTGPVTQKVTAQVEREVLVGGNYPNAVAPWSPGGVNTIGLGYSIASTARNARLFGEASVNFDAAFALNGAERTFTQWRLRAVGRWQPAGITLNGELFAGALVGEPPAQRLFNAAGASSYDMHANVVHRLAMNAAPGFAARNHLILPSGGYLAGLAELPAEARLGRALVNARIRMGDLNPFRSLIPLPLLKHASVELYAAAGWLYRDAVAFDAADGPTIEAGAIASIDLLSVLLPAVVVDAIDSPSPVRLSFHAPLWTSSRLLRADGFAYRWAIGVSR